MVGYKSRGNRCEGEYSARVGAPSLAIAGLTRGTFAHKLYKTETITIKNSTDTAIHIRSSAIDIGTYYRMDALLPKGQTFQWDVEDVLYDLGIPSDLLGVYGWNGSDTNITYIPVKPVSSVYKAGDTSIHLVVRPASKLVSVKYRYAPVGKIAGDYLFVQGSFKSGEPIEVILPGNLQGIYFIEVKALLESKGDWVSAKYQLSFQ